MGNTIYASFADPSLAEKAAGALLDHGVRGEDLSIVRNYDGTVEARNVPVGTSANLVEPTVSDPGIASTGMGNSAANTGEYLAENATTGTTYQDRIDNASLSTKADRLTASEISNASHAAFPTGTGPATNYSYGNTSNIDAPAETIGSENDWTDHGQRTDIDRDGDAYRESDIEGSAKHGISTTTGADAGAGALKGTAWGTGIGAIAALTSLLIPGVGLVAGGGALAIAIGGLIASAGAGAVAGAVTGYLKDQGVDSEIAEHYETTVTNGGAILAVTLPSGNVEEAEARSILDKYGAGSLNAYQSKGYLA